MTDRQKEKELFKNGWTRYYGTIFTKYKDRSYVMKEWLKEPENGPHWYMTKTLEEAYYILEGERLREKYKYETKLKYW
jgi:hypothetical protein